jgi:hypothetical protein
LTPVLFLRAMWRSCTFSFALDSWHNDARAHLRHAPTL